MKSEKLLIVGAGNTLMKDDALGIIALEQLKKIVDNPNVSFFNAGTDIFKLLIFQEKFKKIIILDVIQMGNEPGTIYRLNLDKIKEKQSEVSAHQIKLTEALKLIKLIHKNLCNTEIILYGIEPEEVSFGEGLTKKVNKSLKYLVNIVQSEIENARSIISQKYN